MNSRRNPVTRLMRASRHVCSRLDQNAALVGEHQPPSIGAARHFNPQHRRGRAMETHTDPPVGHEILEVEILPAARHLARVVEQRHVQRETARDPSKLGRRQEAVPVAQPAGLVSAQGPAASELGQQKVRHHVGVVERRLHATAERRSPRFRAGWECAG